MEVKSAVEMAKMIAMLLSCVDSDEFDSIADYADNLDIAVPMSNTIAIKDTNTGKSYLVNVKEAK